MNTAELLKRARKINGGKTDNFKVGAKDDNDIDDQSEGDKKGPKKAVIDPESNERSKINPENDQTNEREVEESQDVSPDSVQKRFNKMTAEKKGAIEEKERVAREFEDYKRRNPEAPPATKQDANPKVSPTSKNAPKMSDFKSVDEWASAFANHTRESLASEMKEHLQKDKLQQATSSKFDELIGRGKKVSDKWGMSPDEYEERVRGDKNSLWHNDAKRALLESPHGHLIAMDILDNMDHWNELAKKGGSAQTQYIGKREAFHEMNADNDQNGMTSSNKQRSSTKASNPDRELKQGFGHLNDETSLSKKNGEINWKAIKKVAKNR